MSTGWDTKLNCYCLLPSQQCPKTYYQALLTKQVCEKTNISKQHSHSTCVHYVKYQSSTFGTFVKNYFII